MGFAWPGASPPKPSNAHEPQGERVVTPFVVEERLEEVQKSGAFTPHAALWLAPTFGESGLLRDLLPQELSLLLGVLSCLSANGAFLATPERVARVVGSSPRVTHQGLERLCHRQWQSAPILLSHRAQTGMLFFAPSPQLLQGRRSVIGSAPLHGQRVRAPQLEVRTSWKKTSREEVVAHSRSTYARPRAQVEAEIEEFLRSGRAGRIPSLTLAPLASGGAPQLKAGAEPAMPEEAATPEARQWLLLKRGLVEAGVPERRADELLENHPPERIGRQLEWLPLRQARSPIAYLLAAIEHDYDPPSGYSPRKDGGAAGLPQDQPLPGRTAGES